MLGNVLPYLKCFMEPALHSHRCPPPSVTPVGLIRALGPFSTYVLCFTQALEMLCHHRVFPDIHSQLLDVTIILTHSTLYLSCELPLSALNVLIY